MAYGFQSTNNEGQTIVGIEEPVYVEVRSGTLTNSGYAGAVPAFEGQVAATSTNTMYKFYITGNAVTTGDEIVFWHCGYHNWVGFPSPTFSGSMGDITAESSTLNYTVMAPRSDNPGPTTGYGAAVYDASGNCLWDSESLATRIVGGYIRRNWTGLGSASLSTGGTDIPYQPNMVTGTGSAVVRINAAYANTNQEGYYLLCVRFTGLDTWTFSTPEPDWFSTQSLHASISTIKVGDLPNSTTIGSLGVRNDWQNTLTILYGITD